MLITLTTDPSEVDFEGLRLRLEAYEIRDCISVQTQDSPKMVLLARATYSDEGFVNHYLRSSEGLLGVDAGRITLSTHEPNVRLNRSQHDIDESNREIYGGFNGRRGFPDMGSHNSDGRYPSNFILQHSDICECRGTKQVESGTAYLDNNTVPGRLYEGGWKGEGVSGKAGYADENGSEKVADWRCFYRCPVHLLDGQSGDLDPQGGKRKTSKMARGMYFNQNSERDYTYGENEQPFYGDKGGASRFFKQCVSTQDLDAYLQALVRTL